MKGGKIPPLASQFVDGQPPVVELPPGAGSSSQNKDAAVIAAVISAIATLFSTGASAVSQYRANQTNINLAEQAYQQNLLQWQRETGYNSPVAQRQRLIAAVLNPGLMYQNGTAGGVAASSPEKDTPSVDPLFSGGSSFGGSAADIGSAYMQNKLLQEQIRAQQLQNDITEETRPTVVGNLRKEGELLAAKISTELVMQVLHRQETYNKHMDELRSEAEFDWASDKFDLDIQEQLQKIKAMDIDNNYKEAANSISLRIMRNNEKISKAQADQAAMQIVVIDSMDEQFAEDQWLIDNFYASYVSSQTNHSLRGNRYKSEGTMSPAEWLQSLPQSLRTSLLSDRVGHLSDNELSEYYSYVGGKAPEKTHWKFSQQKHLDKYKHLYYKRLNQSKIDGLVQGYYSGSTSSSSFGASAFGFGANVH